MTSLPTLTQPAVYRLRLVGRMKTNWADFMPAAQETVTLVEGGHITELSGTVRDQSALYGLLCHLRDLGLPLISVEFIANPQGG